jgi:protocatechuate 3,4-dioxygenase beta subunit
MGAPRLSRRDVLEKALGLGVVTSTVALAPAELLAALEEQAKPRSATTAAELGPFYKRKAPEDPQLRAAGDPGLPLTVNGQVLDTRGNPLPGAAIEIWQTNHLGQYDLDGYRYRARLLSAKDGAYAFESVMPGHYPDRVCQHVHYLVTAPGHKPLVTQLYFATDPVFEGDPDRNFTRDRLITNRELVRPVTLAGDPRDIRAAVRFELVLEAA